MGNQVMMNFKEQPTVKLLAYVDMIANSINQLDAFGRIAVECNQFGGLTDKEMSDIHEIVVKNIKQQEQTRDKIWKELERRLKKECGVSHGPLSTSIMLKKIQSKYPMFGMGQSEIAMYKAKKEKDKEKLVN